jgi:hypothetical protein
MVGRAEQTNLVEALNRWLRPTRMWRCFGQLRPGTHSFGGTVMRLSTRRWAGVTTATLVAALLAVVIGPFSRAGAAVSSANFNLFPNTKFLPCLAAPGQTPRARVTVVKGSTNDTLVLSTSGFKPGLKFDVFTVQRSPQQSDGTAVTGFSTFGLAWYQSDLDANSSAVIKTILVNQIFGFDPDVSLAPTNTFHLGFWFNNPADAAPCGFTGTTPFNGDHTAGPLAFISRPGAVTTLGPLCLDPDQSTPGRCNP